MANLPETSGATFPAARQIENGESQAGGLNGLWNEHAKVMVERTNFLKVLLDASGVGKTAPTINTSAELNSLRINSYVSVLTADVATVGGPAGALGGVVETLALGPNNAAQRWVEISGAAARSWTRAFSGGAWTAWRLALNKDSQTSTLYSVADANDAWIISANIKGDTAVTLGAVTGRCHRLGNLAHVYLIFSLGAFSVPASDDASVSFTLDMAALAIAAGWFATIDAASIGFASGEWVISGQDVPSFMFDTTANSGANTVYFQNTDTLNIPTQAAAATGLNVRMHITMIVGD